MNPDRDRVKELIAGNQEIVGDDELTPRQRYALAKLYRREGRTHRELTYREFRQTVRRGPGCVMAPWCGMWVGVEPDGYTHT